LPQRRIWLFVLYCTTPFAWESSPVAACRSGPRLGQLGFKCSSIQRRCTIQVQVQVTSSFFSCQPCHRARAQAVRAVHRLQVLLACTIGAVTQSMQQCTGTGTCTVSVQQQ
jgi:hypothetical protein